MTPNDFALALSGLAVGLSGCALIWNIWQKFIHVRPSIQVSFGVFAAFPSTPLRQICILTVTNMGPGPVILHACIVRTRDLWSFAWNMGMLNPIEGNPFSTNPQSLGPFSGGLPTKLESGEMKAFYFPFTKDTFLSHPIDQVGISDTYGRNHWCKPFDVQEARRRFKEAFPEDAGDKGIDRGEGEDA